MHAKLDCSGLTDRGLRRRENQDQFLIAHLRKSMTIHDSTLTFGESPDIHGSTQAQLLIVADGMGGHAGGQRASALAVETMAHCLLNIVRWPVDVEADAACRADQERRLIEALDACQARIEEEGLRSPEHSQMGTTLTVALIFWPTLFLLHVGDSRAYLLRQSRLVQLTEDQTLAQQMFRMGAMNAEEFSTSALTHTLWGFLGGAGNSPQPELRQLRLELGDTLLLCSDGLSGPVRPQTLQELLAEKTSADEICRNLVDQALQAGGPDNITAVVARIRDARDVEQLAAQRGKKVPRPEDTQEFDVSNPPQASASALQNRTASRYRPGQ